MIKTGIDLIEISRIRSALLRYGERFLERVFTPAEITECQGKPESLAVRFAAKEAVVKALGTGIGPVSWCEVELSTIVRVNRTLSCMDVHRKSLWLWD